MTLQTRLSQIALGEDSTRQFKANVRNTDSLVPLTRNAPAPHTF